MEGQIKFTLRDNVVLVQESEDTLATLRAIQESLKQSGKNVAAFIAVAQPDGLAIVAIQHIICIEIIDG